jgi:hypothetical protein
MRRADRLFWIIQLHDTRAESLTDEIEIGA